jgi:hypothetical protein
LPAQDCCDKTARGKKEKGEDSQKRSKGQLKQESYNRTARMEQAEQDCQEKMMGGA